MPKHPVNQVAPAPVDNPEAATAQQFARHYAASAVYQTGRLAALEADPGGPEWTNALVALLRDYTAAHLVRALQQHAPQAADEVARDLADALDAGEHVHEAPWDWLMEYGIDPRGLRNAGRAEAGTDNP